MTTALDGDRLEAGLDGRRHPLALLRLLGALSLRGALDASGYCPDWPSSTPFGDSDWAGARARVRFELVQRGRRRVRLDGVGDFCTLRRGAP